MTIFAFSKELFQHPHERSIRCHVCVEESQRLMRAAQRYYRNKNEEYGLPWYCLFLRIELLDKHGAV